MPQSLSNVLIHVVFSTKQRETFLRTPDLRGIMTGYLIGILRNIKCPSLIVGVVEDHAQILCVLHRTMTIAKLVEEVKTSSSGRSPTRWQAADSPKAVASRRHSNAKRWQAADIPTQSGGKPPTLQSKAVASHRTPKQSGGKPPGPMCYAEA